MSRMYSPNASLTCVKAGQISVVTASIFCAKFSDQTGKKRDRVFRRSFNHLPVSEFGDLLDNEQDRNDEAAQVHMISGNFKTEWPRQADAREGRTDVSLTNFTEPIPL